MKIATGGIKKAVALVLLLLVGAIVGMSQTGGQKQREVRTKPERGKNEDIKEMLRLDARLMPSEAEIISSYLATSFGPDKPVPEALKKLLVPARTTQEGGKP